MNRIYADIVNHKHEIKAAICFWHAKKKRGAEDFSTVANALPGIDSLMDSAPQSSALTEKLGSSVPSLGGKASSAAGIASLTESFQNWVWITRWSTNMLPLFWIMPSQKAERP